MSAIENPLKEWMRREKLKASHVASRFGVSEQTIHHWNSKGVPPTRLDFVQRTIAEWGSGSQLGPRIVIQATENQFNAWNLAAMYEGKTIQTWATEGLDELAADFEAQLNEKLEGARPGNPIKYLNADEILEERYRKGLKSLDKVAEEGNGTEGN